MEPRPGRAKKSRNGPPPLPKGVAFNRHKISEGFEKTFIEDYFALCDSPVALSCYLQWKYGEHDDLAQKKIDPHDYVDADSFERDFRAVAFLSKDPGLKTSVDRKARAIAGFLEGENTCAKVNDDLRGYLFGTHVPRFVREGFAQEFQKMRGIIARVLGRFDITECFDSGTWGPGSTLAVTGDAVDQAIKYSVDTSITTGAYHLFWAPLTLYAPNWLVGRTPDFRPGNKVVTVPKNAKTDRTIAIEPGINSWLQLAVGKMIRRRIRRVLGINLNQNALNRAMARLGSLTGEVATLDFRNASNTIAYRLIQALLPEDWWIVMRALRSPVCQLPDGSLHSCEMFSSMGCGFTWELESLIFVAAAIAVCGNSDLIAIFGDDVTLPSWGVDRYSGFVAALGFEVNGEKTYSTSYFRESCGSYFFNGKDVKPIYKKGKYDRPRELFKLANSVTQIAHRHGGLISRDKSFLGLWKSVVHGIPKVFHAFGPKDFGDSVIQVSPYEVKTQRHSSWDGYVFASYGEVPLSGETDDHGLLLARVRRQASEVEEYRGEKALQKLALEMRDAEGPTLEGSNSFSLRQRTKTAFTRRSFVRQWYDFGSWS